MNLKILNEKRIHFCNLKSTAFTCSWSYFQGTPNLPIWLRLIWLVLIYRLRTGALSRHCHTVLRSDASYLFRIRMWMWLRSHNRLWLRDGVWTGAIIGRAWSPLMEILWYRPMEVRVRGAGGLVEQPGVFKSLLCSHSLLRVDTQQTLYEIFGLVRDWAPWLGGRQRTMLERC